jgi:DNA-directed RNA polymerase subunit E'/Rpb7
MKSSSKRREPKESSSLFSKAVLTRAIVLPMTSIGNNVRDVIEKVIKKTCEGKCSIEGYIKEDSCNVITFSSGMVVSLNIKFNVVFECMVACPSEGSIIRCKARNVTKAGICAESLEERPSPIIVHVARDHHFMSEYFSSIKEHDEIEVKVIGQRFELNDKQISIIASLIEKA